MCFECFHAALQVIFESLVRPTSMLLGARWLNLGALGNLFDPTWSLLGALAARSSREKPQRSNASWPRPLAADWISAAAANAAQMPKYLPSATLTLTVAARLFNT